MQLSERQLIARFCGIKRFEDLGQDSGDTEKGKSAGDFGQLARESRRNAL